MNIEILVSQRGKPLLIYDGYLYNFDRIIDEESRWRCQILACKGLLFTKGDNEITRSVNHCHEKETEKIKKKKILMKIKERAMDTDERANEIITRETSKLNEEEITVLPKYVSIRDYYITKKRNKILNYVPSEALDIPLILRNDLQGNGFFRYDSGIYDDSRIIIFGSTFKENLIDASKIWLIDGTFSAAPLGFYQILTIQTYAFGRTFPLIYVFMKDKKEQSYKNAFLQIKKYFNNPRPETIIIDFERALNNALSDQFPDSALFGCLFHFGQAIWKRIQSSRRTLDYKSKKLYNNIIHLLLNLAFVPPLDVTRLYFKLLNFIKEKGMWDTVEDFIQYFETTYIGKYDENHTLLKNPMYSVCFWNAYDRVLSNLPRTTNSLEGWHRSFNKKVEIAHPNIALLITILQAEEENNRFNIIKSLKGQFQLSRKNYLKEETILTCVKNYHLFKDVDYLFVISKSFDWDFSENDLEKE